VGGVERAGKGRRRKIFWRKKGKERSGSRGFKIGENARKRGDKVEGDEWRVEGEGEWVRAKRSKKHLLESG
jgi:hypothetical protein